MIYDVIHWTVPGLYNKEIVTDYLSVDNKCNQKHKKIPQKA